MQVLNNYDNKIIDICTFLVSTIFTLTWFVPVFRPKITIVITKVCCMQKRTRVCVALWVISAHCVQRLQRWSLRGSSSGPRCISVNRQRTCGWHENVDRSCGLSRRSSITTVYVLRILILSPHNLYVHTYTYTFILLKKMTLCGCCVQIHILRHLAQNYDRFAWW